jgi:ATP-dependent Lon protease
MKRTEGFAVHVKNERELIRTIQEDRIFEQERPSVFGQRRPKEREFVIPSNCGALELFSISTAYDLYENAYSLYGEERYKYARSKLVDATKSGNRRKLKQAFDLGIFNTLREEFPNFSDAIDLIEGAAALSTLTSDAFFYIPPLLLLGPPGVGKTHFCQTLGKLIDLDFSRIDIGTASSSASLMGLSFSWSTGQAGEIFNSLTNAEYANPIIMLDEIDKAVGNHSAPIAPALLCLLERENAKQFRDEGIQLPLNASHVNWIATANHLDTISAPVLSRLLIAQIRPPCPDQTVKIIKTIYQGIISSNSWGKEFEGELRPGVIERLLKLSPREIGNQLRQGFGKAARENRRYVDTRDILIIDKPRAIKMGFI